MRHRVASKQLGRDTKHREALFKNLLRELVEHGTIKTTIAKAKVIQPIADKMITKAKVGDLAARRQLHMIFGKRDVVNTLMERVVPAVKARTSGFTRITPIGLRSGDNAMMVELTWVDKPENVGTLMAPVKKTQPTAKKSPAKTVKTETKTAEKPAENEKKVTPAAKKSSGKAEKATKKA